MVFDWNRFYAEEHPAVSAVDSRLRLRICLAGFVVLLLIVAARAVHIEITQGDSFRAEAARPLVNRHDLPGVRGLILAADGGVLAYDKKVLALALHYRYLQEPPDRRWLSSAVRSRLTRAQRKDERRVAAEETLVINERRLLNERLAELCELPIDEWDRRARRVQTRVQRIADSVNRRRFEKARLRQAEKSRRGPSPLDRLKADDDFLPQQITVREELDSHIMVEDVPLAVVAEIEAHAELYPGASIVERRRRFYPRGNLAAHVLGYLGKPSREEIEAGADDVYHGEDLRGRGGVELQYDKILHGRRGELVETTDQGGRILSSQRELEPGVGQSLTLTIEPRLQETAQSLLDDALRRRTVAAAKPQLAGGAIVVMDARSGAVLTAASAPGFDPNCFGGDESTRVAILLHDPARPLFDRVSQMAIAPGSVFKTVTAVALLQEGKVEPDEPFACQGYLKSPQRLRCAIYRRRGIGHAQVTLTDALAQSCNVYFFHHVAGLEPNRLADWAAAFGLGQSTGIDLPGEAAGCVPRPQTIQAIENQTTQERQPWHVGDTQMLAIGQGSLTATPLQIARLTAAVANGGRLVTPHVVSRLGKLEFDDHGSAAADDSPDKTENAIPIPRPQKIDGLNPDTLAAIRRGMRAAVEDEKGTAHATLGGDSVSVACKTGTAETGGDRYDHAWVAGYAPADKPRYVFVVALEHAGNASEAACPVAKRLLTRMEQLGLL